MHGCGGIMRRAFGLLLAAALFAAVLVAGRGYLVCRTTNAVMDGCCASEQHDATPALDVASCCEVRTHASPGDAVQPTITAAMTSDLPPALGAPLAIVAPAPSSRAENGALPDWTGPPLDQRRARLSVFLL
jgi:hypothetical protein